MVKELSRQLYSTKACKLKLGNENYVYNIKLGILTIVWILNKISITFYVSTLVILIKSHAITLYETRWIYIYKN